VGGSIPNGEEDISPYATFHLLGMREENKNLPAGHPHNFQTLPSQGSILRNSISGEIFSDTFSSPQIRDKLQPKNNIC
jgi:hypothetical protein